MILCLDAGNTRLKYGVHRDGCWFARGALDYSALETLPDCLTEVPKKLIVCNVAGATVMTRISELATRWGILAESFLSSAEAGGVKNSYLMPGQLGADRWAALIGARALHFGDALVVMAGTATTVDVLAANGEFRGGAILPGLALMHTALAEKTAGLPLARGSYRDLPRTTDDAIASGCIQATLGAIERIARLSFGASLPDKFLCLMSGGAAPDLAGHLNLPLLCVEDLVLEGLALISETGKPVSTNTIGE